MARRMVTVVVAAAAAVAACRGNWLAAAKARSRMHLATHRRSTADQKRQSNHIAHFDEGSKATQGMQAWPALSASLAFLRFEGGGRTDSELGLCTDSAALPS